MDKKYTKRMCHLCNRSVVHLSRHLRDVHDFTEQAAIDGRKDMTLGRRSAKPKNRCLFPHCHTWVVNVAKHMQQIHHTTITAYKKVVENARNEVAVLQAMSDDEFERFADSQMHNPEQSGMEKLN